MYVNNIIIELETIFILQSCWILTAWSSGAVCYSFTSWSGGKVADSYLRGCGFDGLLVIIIIISEGGD